MVNSGSNPVSLEDGMNGHNCQSPNISATEHLVLCAESRICTDHVTLRLGQLGRHLARYPTALGFFLDDPCKNFTLHLG